MKRDMILSFQWTYQTANSKSRLVFLVVFERHKVQFFKHYYSESFNEC